MKNGLFALSKKVTYFYNVSITEKFKKLFDSFGRDDSLINIKY